MERSDEFLKDYSKARDHSLIVARFLHESTNTLDNVRTDADLMIEVATAAAMMSDAINNGYKILTCGNGGSACDAMHFASELTGKYKEKRRPINAICLNTDVAAMTCIANDFGYEEVFERLVYAYAAPGDVLLALSTSGGSANVLNAMMAANQKGCHIVGITGQAPNDDFAEQCKDGSLIKLPSDKVAIIQQCTMTLLHVMVELIESEL